MSDFKEVKLGKITQKQFDSHIAGFELDLIALFKIMEQEIMEIDGELDAGQIMAIINNMFPDGE